MPLAPCRAVHVITQIYVADSCSCLEKGINGQGYLISHGDIQPIRIANHPDGLIYKTLVGFGRAFNTRSRCFEKDRENDFAGGLQRLGQFFIVIQFFFRTLHGIEKYLSLFPGLVQNSFGKKSLQVF